MISKNLQNAINNQIHSEIYSSYLYMAMAAYADGKNFKGIANWFKVQSQEEWEHAMKFYNFLVERGAYVIFKAIEQPPSDFKSILQAFEATLEHEKKVTASIHKLYELAVKEGDYPTQVMLHWFINEQVEEEANAMEIIEKIKLVGEKSGSILWIDKELGSREK
ncbi:MAG: Ferritin [Ignavibacteriae bacterium]|nr:MAG: Ferritin [Ignavibacteriota bacterium]